MEFLIQVFSLMSLLIGILTGETMTVKAFGRPKPKIILVDMFVFVLVLVGIYSFVGFTNLGAIFYLINLVKGNVVIVFIRGFEAIFKFTEPIKREENIAVNVIRALSRYVLDEDEIKAVLKRSGLNPKTVDSLKDVIEANVPVYLPRLIKMETEIEQIEKELKEVKRILSKKTSRKKK